MSRTILYGALSIGIKRPGLQSYKLLASCLSISSLLVIGLSPAALAQDAFGTGKQIQGDEFVFGSGSQKPDEATVIQGDSESQGADTDAKREVGAISPGLSF